MGCMLTTPNPPSPVSPGLVITKVKDHISLTPLQPRVALHDNVPADDVCQGLCAAPMLFVYKILFPLYFLFSPLWAEKTLKSTSLSHEDRTTLQEMME